MKRIIFILTLFIFAFTIKAQESDFKSIPSDYFTSQSSFSLKKGEGRYSNTWVFFNDFQLGVTDYESMCGYAFYSFSKNNGGVYIPYLGIKLPFKLF